MTRLTIAHPDDVASRQIGQQQPGSRMVLNYEDLVLTPVTRTEQLDNLTECLEVLASAAIARVQYLEAKLEALDHQAEVIPITARRGRR